jgi:hypothetical protein
MQTALSTDAADPDITWDGRQYVLHTTNTGYGNVPAWTSSDLSNWTFAGDALPKLPTWADAGWTWAPTSIRRADGRWFLYFSAAVKGKRTKNGQPLKCLGVASAMSATGPFTVVKERDAAPLLCQPNLGGDIDPSTYRQGSNGYSYLVTKTDGNSSALPTTIQNRRLDSNLWSFARGLNPSTLLKSTTGTWEGQIIEGPDLLATSGRLHLLYSGGDFASTAYGEGQARCGSTGTLCVRNGRLLDDPAFGAGAGGASAFGARTGSPLLAWHAYKEGTKTRLLSVGTLSTTSTGGLAVTGSPLPTASSRTSPQQRAAGLPGSVQLTVPENQPITVPNAHTR